MPKMSKSKNGYVTKKDVKKMIDQNQETKFSYVLFNGGAGDAFNSGLALDKDLNALATGVGQTNRIGNEVKHTGMYGRLFMEAPLGGSAPAQALCRCIIYIPRNPSDTLSIAYNEQPDTDRFSLLYDKLFVVGSDASILRTKVLNVKKKLRTVTRWSGASATAYAKSPIKFYCISDSIDDVFVSGFIKTYFKDA